MPTELRQLPSVDKLLQTDQLTALAHAHSRPLIVEAIRLELDAARRHILAGLPPPSLNDLERAVAARLSVDLRPSLRPVINATGVIIHTNLGRALLSRRAQAAMTQAASAYSNLEYDLDAGERGSRYVHAADLLRRLTGAEAAV
ncbi:MAG: L-seryl-tRNA(Sec) selenium transferase, partial [Dehalococcoidia bacterium]